MKKIWLIWILLLIYFSIPVMGQSECSWNNFISVIPLEGVGCLVPDTESDKYDLYTSDGVQTNIQIDYDNNKDIYDEISQNNEAILFNQNPDNQAYRKDFIEYLKSMPELTEQDIEGILKDPVSIKEYQKKLGVIADGKIGPDTAKAAYENTPQTSQPSVGQTTSNDPNVVNPFSGQDGPVTLSTGHDFGLVNEPGKIGDQTYTHYFTDSEGNNHYFNKDKAVGVKAPDSEKLLRPDETSARIAGSFAFVEDTMYFPSYISGKTVPTEAGRSIYLHYTHSYLDPITGERIYFDNLDPVGILDKDGNLIKISDDEQLSSKLKKLAEEVKKANPELTRTNAEQFWVNFQDYTATAAGYSGYSSLLLSDEALGNWKEKIDKSFAQFLGIDAWTSLICEASFEIDNEFSQGTAIVNNGFIQVGAHVEGERSSPIEYDFFNETKKEVQHKTQYLYKLSYFMQNSINKDIKFNVYVSGPSGTANLYAQSQVLVPGGKAGLTGESMYVTYSENLYNKICIDFIEGYLETDGAGGVSKTERLDTELCNVINGAEISTYSPASYSGGSSGEGLNNI